MIDEKLLEPIREEGGAEIMKASAGSGKTYSLSREYIRVLLTGNKEERHYHRHILAVTFTNKATENMKSEIVKALDVIARNPAECEYAADMVRWCGFADVKELSAAARIALNDILNDYGAFSISTIDRFFQQTLKAFAREIGHNSDYRVELDKESLVAESADRLLDSLSEEDTALLRWLSDSAIEKMESGEKPRLEQALQDFAGGYLSPDYDKKRARFDIDDNKAFSEENLKRLSRTCREIIQNYNREVAKLAGDTLKEFDRLGLRQKNSGYLRTRLQTLASAGKRSFKWKDIKVGTWANACVDFKAALNSNDQKLVSDAQSGYFASLFSALDDYSERPFHIYKTAQKLIGQVYVFRTAEALKAQYDALLREKNVLGLDDTNDILRDIIGGTDAPFIYERTGTRYKHFLLDEFQDTSVIQWECLRPLLVNSISEGCYNLIVGDVKQSIYRWRDADWHILGNQVQAELKKTIVNPLDVNWRSAEAIIDFNNRFYRHLADSIGIKGIYDELHQDPGGKVTVPGCVDISFCDDKEVNRQVLDAVHEAQDRGFRLKDIAIIVRVNKQGGDIASFLSANGVDVITDDSLRIESSDCVREVVSALSHLDDPENKIYAYGAPCVDEEILADARSIFDMADALIKQMPKERTSAQTQYILAFMDLIRDFVSKNGNSLHGFLEYWKEKGFESSISCTKDSDAVTIITIHKSKGLDYPYVILPIRTTELVMKTDSKHWDKPDTEGTPLDACEPALYNVELSEDSLFRRGYEEELGLCTVDYLNTFYVATTRAVEELRIVSPKPSGKRKISEYLHAFVTSSGSGFVPTEDDRYILGTKSAKAPLKKKEVPSRMDLTYDTGHGVHSFVRISSDAAEYFTGEGDNSARKRGIVLHGIMQDVQGPADLHTAVCKAVSEGLLIASEAGSTEAMLSEAVNSVMDRGWFPEDGGKVISERDIITSDMKVKRPDRVVFTSGETHIIDYKFGEPNSSYAGQVREYMTLYADMGYCNVRGFLWYVDSGNVVEV